MSEFRTIPVHAAVTLECAEKAALLAELFNWTLAPGLPRQKNYIAVRGRDWQKMFPWMSLRKVQRYLQELKERGMICYTVTYSEAGVKGDTMFSITAKGVETLFARSVETCLDVDAMSEEAELAKKAFEEIISSQNIRHTNVTTDATNVTDVVSPRHQCRKSASPVSQSYNNSKQEQEQQNKEQEQHLLLPGNLREAQEPQSAGVATAVIAQARTSPEPQAREALQDSLTAVSYPPPSSAPPPPRKKRAPLPEFVPPSLEEWIAYLPEHDATRYMPKLAAESSYDYYSSNDWKRKDGSKVKDWRHTLRDCGRRWRERNQDKWMEMMRFEQTQARQAQSKQQQSQQRSLPDDF